MSKPMTDWQKAERRRARLDKRNCAKWSQEEKKALTQLYAAEDDIMNARTYGWLPWHVYLDITQAARENYYATHAWIKQEARRDDVGVDIGGATCIRQSWRNARLEREYCQRMGDVYV